jgi:probable F420-dependent oxidoreductase
MAQGSTRGSGHPSSDTDNLQLSELINLSSLNAASEVSAPVQLGLHALGIGAGARPGVIGAVAVAAEAAGFGTLWAGEHVVMVDRGASRYPYAPDGRIAVPADADWLDPMVALCFAAARTHTIGLATGVLLLPEHNPVILAKQAASLDRLCDGRFALGIGVGWSREEFAALGIPFERRGARADEYLTAMRTLWREDPASFTGEFVRFADIRVNPKPLREGGIPVIVGGNSDAALRRAARAGDGWYGFNLADLEQVAERVERLRQLCTAADRDPSGLHIAVALADPRPGDPRQLAAIGVDELVLVASPPDDPAQADAWVTTLAANLL